uniref:CAF1C_H4-bd domain-containing protein n=2 Tax=Bursaphelenchus xylophilus TaxID=6326 RepID=A0A1I7SMM8_BURXY
MIPSSKIPNLDPRNREHKHLLTNAEKNIKLKVLELGEPLEASVEANMRHDMRQFYPVLKLRPESITNHNYATVKERFPDSFKPHPKKEPEFKEENLCTNVITWDKDCDVYVVYAIDSCRGELEKDENTMDEGGNNSNNASSSSSAKSG